MVGAGVGWWVGDYGVQRVSGDDEWGRDVVQPGGQRDQLHGYERCERDEYYYEVSAVNGVGEGGLSGELSATAGATSVIASDVFDRSVAGGFGSPDVGAPWSVSSTSQTKVANGEGVIYGWTGGNKDIQAWIPTMANDMDVLAKVRLSAQSPVGANYQARVVARAQTDARNGYTGVITHTTAGAAKWSLNRVVNAGGTGTLTLGSGTLLASGADGTTWWIRIDVQGTQIKVRYWQDGTTEPSTWKASVTDSQWTSGRPALGVYVGSGLTSPFPDTGFDSFTPQASVSRGRNLRRRPHSAGWLGQFPLLPAPRG